MFIYIYTQPEIHGKGVNVNYYFKLSSCQRKNHPSFFSPLIYHEKDKDNCFLLFFLAQFESRGTLLLWSIWRSFFVVQRKEINLTEKNIVYHWYQKKAIEIFDSTLPSILMSIVFMLSHPEMWTNCQYVVKPSSIIIRIIKCVSPTEWARLNLFCSNSYKI